MVHKDGHGLFEMPKAASSGRPARGFQQLCTNTAAEAFQSHYSRNVFPPGHTDLTAGADGAEVRIPAPFGWVQGLLSQFCIISDVQSHMYRVCK